MTFRSLQVCKRHGAWLHVDAAWAGSALICEEHRWMLDEDGGVDFVDSIAFNPHKWVVECERASARALFEWVSERVNE